MNSKNLAVFTFMALLALPVAYCGTSMPSRFFIDVDSINIVFSQQEPNKVQISIGDKVVSYGQDWEVKKLKPNLFQLRQQNWKDFFFQVTDHHKVQKISGGTFGQLGGKQAYLRARVKAVGGSNTCVTFSRLARPYIVVSPRTKEIQIATQECVFSYGRNLSLAQLTPYIYHFRHKLWSNFHWQVNTHRKTVHLIRDGVFGKTGGSLDTLPYVVRVVDSDEIDKSNVPVRPVSPAKPKRPVRPTEPVATIAFPGLPTKAPGQVRIHFPELAMTFTPDGKSLRIVAGNKVVCYGDGWKVSTNSHQSYNLLQKMWKGFHYQVNAAQRQLFVVKNGDRRKLPADVLVIGRGNVRLGMGKSANPYLVFVPGSDEFQVVAFGHVLHDDAGWSRAQPESHIFHLKNRNWRGFFWKVDTNRKLLTMVKAGTFGGGGGTEHRLPYKVVVK